MGGQPSRLPLLRQQLLRLRRMILKFLIGFSGLLYLAADLRGLCSNRSFLLQDLHISGCDGLVAFPGGFKASTPPFCWSTHSFCSLRALFLLRMAYKVLQSGYFFIFGDLLSTPHFPFLCCRPDSNTIVPTQPVPLLDEGILSKRKGIYILKGYFTFPPRRQGNV